MANLRDIRRRIRSVTTTAQITRAMQMVAAAKMRRAQQAAIQGRPYAALLGDILREVTSTTAQYRHALMEVRPVQTTAVVLISTDKGLCGSLNTNLFRELQQYDQASTVFIAVGRRGAQLVARSRRRLMAEFTWRETHLLGMARMVSRFVSGLFLDGDIDRAEVVYTDFISTLHQEPRRRPFLPISEIGTIVNDMDLDGRRESDKAAGSGIDRLAGCQDFVFEPSLEDVLQPLLVPALDFLMYQVILEARASENSSRMVAMKNATDNAHELVRGLTLDYNKLRQAAITGELIEISSALANGG